MVQFIPARELKGKYDVFGHFYSVEVAPKKVAERRSVLEIVEGATLQRRRLHFPVESRIPYSS